MSVNEVIGPELPISIPAPAVEVVTSRKGTCKMCSSVDGNDSCEMSLRIRSGEVGCVRIFILSGDYLSKEANNQDKSIYDDPDSICKFTCVKDASKLS